MVPLGCDEWFSDVGSVAVVGCTSSRSRVALDALGDASRT
jgi:hypothetical protein